MVEEERNERRPLELSRKGKKKKTRKRIQTSNVTG